MAGDHQLARDRVEIAISSRSRAANIDRVARSTGASLDRGEHRRVCIEHVHSIRALAESQIHRLNSVISDAVAGSIAARHAETPNSISCQVTGLGSGFILVIDVQGIGIGVAIDDQQPGDSVGVPVRADADGVVASAGVNGGGCAGERLLDGQAVRATVQVERDCRAAVAGISLLDIDGSAAAAADIHDTR